jgi:hypothetical protein
MKIFIQMFGYEHDILPEAVKTKLTKTEGWRIFIQQRECEHIFKTLFVTLTGHIKICNKCGVTDIDGGYPEN